MFGGWGRGRFGGGCVSLFFCLLFGVLLFRERKKKKHSSLCVSVFILSKIICFDFEASREREVKRRRERADEKKRSIGVSLQTHVSCGDVCAEQKCTVTVASY